MSVKPSFLVFVSQNVVLPEHDEPVSAVIKVDTNTGKFVDVVLGRPSLRDISEDESVECIDVGSNYILPGLVECVRVFFHPAPIVEHTL
jgi:allantoinase